MTLSIRERIRRAQAPLEELAILFLLVDGFGRPTLEELATWTEDERVDAELYLVKAYAQAGDHIVHMPPVPARLQQLREAEATKPERACRVCGCTQERGCWPRCWWVEYDLCSGCAG